MLCGFCLLTSLHGQEIRQYVAKKTVAALKIDGKLNEPEWQAAVTTEKFITPVEGNATRLSTQAKFLWNDTYLYIGFICEDTDVWTTITQRDAHLWDGEVVEIFCDPDGDGLDYLEIQVNPLGTVMDLFMKKPYSVEGKPDFSWDIKNLKAAVWIDGTINNPNDVDSLWTCEVALPFNELAFAAPSQSFPPHDGDLWRMLVSRYDYARDSSFVTSCWNQTNANFHTPSKYGKIIFSKSTVIPIAK